MKKPDMEGIIIVCSYEQKEKITEYERQILENKGMIF
jgi:hypothetical protein